VLYGNESISTYTRPNMTIWMALAFQAGLLNIGGLMACGTFVSHVTGFATLFGLELGRQNYAHAFGLLLTPGFFMLGAMISAALVDLRIKLGKKPKYYIVFGVMFALTLILVIMGYNRVFGEFGEPLLYFHDYFLLSLLTMICGIQNATVSLVSRSVVRTTHLTGVTTDLGIGLVRVMNAYRIKSSLDEERHANIMRIGIISFFVLGSAIGYSVFKAWQFRGFLFPLVICGLLFFVTLYFQVYRPAVASRS
jgi:uncharacterized membrane protein YoaK (UPF0700 family)